MQRKFAHIDMDAFYVSVEIRDKPALVGQPVAVGSKNHRRGVISTCNYIARSYGIRSAMPTALALKKCPQLVLVPGRMQVYKETSQTIRDIFSQYTDKIEPLSLDEAYLDLSATELHQGSATLIAQEIRQKIYQQTELTASAGIAPLKFLAKIASDLNKPNGQYTIAPNEVMAFVKTLQLNKIPGVGKVTAEKLRLHGFVTCHDVQRAERAQFLQLFGKYGQVLWQRCHGIDERELEIARIRKSVGVERTFEFDIADLTQLKRIMHSELIPELIRRASPYLQTRNMNKLGVKLKFNDFQQTTKEQKCAEINSALLDELLTEALQRGAGKTVRLLGVHIGLDSGEKAAKQLGLDLL